MAAEEKNRLVVVKRIKKVEERGHSSAWKIAYGDFITAMMAFFLLMWLLGTTNKSDLDGIEDYFKTPLKVALEGGSSSAERSSVIHGGGRDLTSTEGQVKRSNAMPQVKVVDLKQAQEQVMEMERQRELDRLNDLKARIEQAINENARLRQFKNQILLDLTSEGLRIQIVDEQNRPMFSSGSAELEPYTREILHEIGLTLNQVPNKISLSGHTDARAYAGNSKGYSNWDLSADRANASRRELIAGGMAQDKVVRVVGLSSSVLFDSKDPLNPVNRRISIIVMNKKAEEEALHDGGTVQVDAKDPTLPAAAGLGPAAGGQTKPLEVPAVSASGQAAPQEQPAQPVVPRQN